jgi:hypothetical protein
MGGCREEMKVKEYSDGFHILVWNRMMKPLAIALSQV